MKNLTALEKLAVGGDDVHLVTQLVVSLLALIVFPRERDDDAFKQLHDVSLADLERDGWPKWKNVEGGATTLAELLIHLRHAISHGNVSFNTEERRYEDVELIFTNKLRGKSAKWEGAINASGLRRFCDRLYDRIMAQG